MAGSYHHCVDERGQLLVNEYFTDMIENLGDAYEAVEEMYGMIWYLAQGDAAKVEDACAKYKIGLEMSPGTDGELVEDDDG